MSIAEILKERRRTACRIMALRVRTGESGWHNLCQKGVRTALGAPGGAPSAKAAWQGLPRAHKRRGDGPPPRGVPVYFKMNTPYWHATLSAGRGYVWSNDIIRPGRWDKVKISYIERRWNATYLGWATHINGDRIW